MSSVLARLRLLRSPAAIPGWFGIAWKVAETLATLDFIRGLSANGGALMTFLRDHGSTVAMILGFLWLGWLVLRVPKGETASFPKSVGPYRPMLIAGKKFVNERVALDGHAYQNCTFEHVTFVYNGVTPIQFNDNDMIPPVRLHTDNPVVTAAMLWLKGFGALADTFDLQTGPEIVVKPPKRVPQSK